MVDTSDFVGLAIRTIRGRQYVVADLTHLRDPRDGHDYTNETIYQLSLFFRCDPSVILDAVRRDRAGLRFLWRNYTTVGSVLSESEHVSTSEMLREVNDAASVDQRTGSGQVIDRAYWHWTLPGSAFPTLVIPLNAGFTEALTQESLRVRVLAVQPYEDRLLRQLTLMGSTTRTYNTWADTLKDFIRIHGGAPDVAVLSSLQGLIATMKLNGSSAQQTQLQPMQDAIDGLLDKFKTSFVTNPFFGQFEIQQRNQAAEQLYAAVQEYDRTLVPDTNVHLVDDVAAVLRDWDACTNDFRTTFQTNLRDAFRALLESPRDDDTFRNFVLPMMQNLAHRQGAIQTDLAQANVREFLDNIRQNVSAPNPPSNFGLLSTVAGAIPTTVGNVPGPSSLCVVIMEYAAPHIAQYALDHVSDASRLTSWLFKAVCQCTAVDAATRAQALEAAANEDVAAIRALNIPWGNRGITDFMGSARTSAIIGLLNLVVLVNAIFYTHPDPTDRRAVVNRWLQIFASGTGILLAGVAILNTLKLISLGIAKAAGAGLAFIGGALAIVMGYRSLQDAQASGDRLGEFVALATIAGGVASVAGFLWVLAVTTFGSGAAADGTVVLAPVGTALMLVGAVIGVVAAVVGIITAILDALRHGSERVYRGGLSYFARPVTTQPSHPEMTPGVYQMGVFEHVPGLEAAYNRVDGLLHGTEFWDVDQRYVPQLADLGFNVDQVKLIVHTDDTALVQRLGAGHFPS